MIAAGIFTDVYCQEFPRRILGKAANRFILWEKQRGMIQPEDGLKSFEVRL